MLKPVLTFCLIIADGKFFLFCSANNNRLSTASGISFVKGPTLFNETLLQVFCLDNSSLKDQRLLFRFGDATVSSDQPKRPLFCINRLLTLCVVLYP